MNEDKATRYHRRRRWAHVASLAATATSLLVLVAGGGGVWLRDVAAAGASLLVGPGLGQRLLASAIAAALLAALIQSATLGSSYYAGFALERRYGLSRQQAGEWWGDHLKGVALATGLAVVLAPIVYGAIEWRPASWWLVAGLLLGLLSAALVVVAPVVVLPLFYRFRPLDHPELSDRLGMLASRAGTPVLGVFEWTLGEKSRAANAALVGSGPTRRILLSDTLLAEYSPDEIEVIIAHELAHHVHGDIWQGLVVEAVMVTTALLAGHLALSWWVPLAGASSPADLAGMPLLALVAGTWSLATTPVMLALSRHHERQADAFALDLTGKSEAFISAMRRLGAQNLADEQPAPLVEWLFHSHPSLTARVAFARRWATEHEAATPLTA